MSEKHLTEAAWKVFAKGRNLKDAALVKALAEVDKSGKAPPAERTSALDALRKQVDALKKLAKDDKDVVAYLNEIDRQAIAARKAAVEAQAQEEEEEAEEDTPALLGSKTLTALREVVKGVPGHAMIAVVGKACAVIVSMKPLSSSARKPLAEQLKNASGIKYLDAQCIFEQKAHTFVFPRSIGGLAARLQIAIAEQTGQKPHVRVRGADPKDVDEAAAEAESASHEAVKATPTTAASTSPTSATTDLLAAFNQLMPQIRQYIAANADHKTAMLKLVEQFQVLAKAGNAAHARPMLADIVGMLKAQARPASPGDARAAALAAWQAERATVVAALKQLETAIRGMRDPEGDAAIILVKAIQANLTVAPSTPQAVSELDRYLRTDDILDEAEGPNGFGIAIRIREPLLKALAGLRASFAAA